MIRVLIVLAAFGWGTQAYAFSDNEKLAATNKLAEIRTAETYCPELKVNQKMADDAIAQYKIDVNSIDAKILNVKKMAMAQRSVKKAGAKAWCDALKFMYGPKGIAGKGLLIEK